MLLLGDCNHWLKEIKDESIDLIVTDPPYGIEFMGKDWDKALVNAETWKECYRVLKQGKLAFVMCSPRQDVLSRMIVNLQDAGFRTNYTSIYWTFASGFPKAANISKLLDKKNGRTDTEYQQLADYLKEKRKESKYSSNEIAKLFPFEGKINNWCVWRWENAHTVPIKADYQILKSKLNLDDRFDYLIEREEAKREIISRSNNGVGNNSGSGIYQINSSKSKLTKEYDITKPATEEAKKMEGAYVGFQPKPAVEVILVVSKGKTLTWLDDCRIPYQSEHDWFEATGDGNTVPPNTFCFGNKATIKRVQRDSLSEKGRFPANLLVSDDVLNDGKDHKVSIRPINTETDTGMMSFPSFNGVCIKCGKLVITPPKHVCYSEDEGKVFGVVVNTETDTGNGLTHGKMKGISTVRGYNDSGSYSRYFSLDAWAKTFPFLIVPKASASERNKGCEDLPFREVGHGPNTICGNCGKRYLDRSNTCECKIKKEIKHSAQNFHPTVKPLKLMSYLITMGSREGDLVLDPFCGSGTVCIAAHQLHRKWLGIEMNPEYAEIIKKRLADPLAQLKLTSFA